MPSMRVNVNTLRLLASQRYADLLAVCPNPADPLQSEPPLTSASSFAQHRTVCCGCSKADNVVKSFISPLLKFAALLKSPGLIHSAKFSLSSELFCQLCWGMSGFILLVQSGKAGGRLKFKKNPTPLNLQVLKIPLLL